MKQTKVFLLAIVAMLMVACTSREKSLEKETPCPVLGSWVKPIEGISGFDGIELKEGGLASSINSSTLLYETWSQKDDEIVLSGKSVGNGQTIAFSERYKVHKCDADSLVLVGENIVLRFARQK